MDVGLNLRPFQGLSTILQTAGTSNTVYTFTAAQDISAPHIMVCNEGAVPAYIGIGAAATVPTGTPSLNSIPVPANQTLMFFKGAGVAVIGVILGSSTGAVSVTAGVGS